jgi:membrane-bound metal-dependent hydrolase YbcI (DUF457 family)
MNKREHILNGILLGIGMGYIIEPGGGIATYQAMALATPPLVMGAMFPDIDTEFGKHRKTLHNLPVLLFFYAYALQFQNLSWVWIGVFSHYVLDIAGSTRGISWFYPFYGEEFGLPIGVPTSSDYAQWITVFITVGELLILYAVDTQFDVDDTTTLWDYLIRLAGELPVQVPTLTQQLHGIPV